MGFQAESDRPVVRPRQGRHARPGRARLGQLAVEPGRPGAPQAARRLRGQEQLRIRRREEHAVRHPRGERTPEDGRHDLRRRHGELGVGAHRRGRQPLLPAGRTRRPAVHRRVFPGPGRAAGDRRHRRTDEQPAGHPRRRTAAARRLRRRPADHGRRRCPGARPDGRLAKGADRGPAEAPARGAGEGDGPAFPLAAHHGRPLPAGPDRRPAAADRPRAARGRFVRAAHPGPVRRPARHRDRGAAGTQRAGAPARQPDRRGGRRPRSVRRRAERARPDRGGAHRRAALPAAGGRRARQGRARAAAGDLAAGLQLVGQPVGGRVGRGADPRRAGSQRQVL